MPILMSSLFMLQCWNIMVPAISSIYNFCFKSRPGVRRHVLSAQSKFSGLRLGVVNELEDSITYPVLLTSHICLIVDIDGYHSYIVK
jgi:hypothetical protein